MRFWVIPGSSRVVRGQALGREQYGWPWQKHSQTYFVTLHPQPLASVSRFKVRRICFASLLDYHPPSLPLSQLMPISFSRLPPLLILATLTTFHISFDNMATAKVSYKKSGKQSSKWMKRKKWNYLDIALLLPLLEIPQGVCVRWLLHPLDHLGEDFCDDDALKVDGWVGLVGYDPWVGGGLVGAGCAAAPPFTHQPPLVAPPAGLVAAAY